ncbi:phage tail protein [Pseudomonas sp. GZD-222]|uniref:phage tail protein n=1 Tax=Pseudomonas sp. GZD-222 TaxID=3404805 RepID=UPI003BB7AED8
MVDQTSQFYAILTTVGAAKQANADALGIPWKITQMAVGDGNPAGLENPALPMPDASARALLNEWRRAPLNQLKVDDKNSAVIVAEQVIPADVGGRWIRELALYDADGDMIAVANCAPTYKPLLNQGSGRTQVVRMNLIVSSASNVQLKIDPSVVLATREWVTEELAKQDFKHSVLVATTAAITLSGLQSVDGVALSAGARVLVKNQAAAKDNGLYLVVAGGAWTRCSDADTSAKVTPGMLVPVEKGTINADSTWQLVTDSPITLGVSALAFEMAFGRTGVAAGSYRSVTVDAYGRVVAATNPTTVAGYALTDVYTKGQIDQAIALKANLASPVFTGAPSAPTAAVGTNTGQLANTAFVQAAIAALVASSPEALDTLKELASAIGNDPNFATTMVNQLALKAPLAGPIFTGDPRAPTPAITDNDTSVATTAFVRNLLARYGLATSNAFIWTGNIDLIIETGLYTSNNDTTGTRPKHPTLGIEIIGGMLFHMERNVSTCALQIWESITSGVGTPLGGLTFKRSRLASGVWTDWEELITSRHLPFRGVRSITALGASTWVVPQGVNSAWVEVIGGGGGGGRFLNGGGGGGGGGRSRRLVSGLVPGATIAVVVGAGGTGRIESNGDGESGGSSSFGAYLSASGGGGASKWFGGSGGIGIGGDVNDTLGPGHHSTRHDNNSLGGTSSNYGGGHGGGARGGGSGSGATGWPGTSGTVPGSGGGGGNENGNGGDGSAGRVTIWW